MTRIERVQELIRAEISRIIREDVNDPRIGFVSITRVTISADLENASIMVSILDSEERKTACMFGLQSATSFIRGKLGDALDMKAVPELRFVRDDSLEKGSQVLNIISKLENKDHERNPQRNKKRAKKS